MNNIVKKILIIVVLILIGASSFFYIGDIASSPEKHHKDIVAIEDKVDTVLKFTGSSALLSAGISVLPGDIATPIAEKLADITDYFLLVLCVLYSEKYLLTLLGAGVFKVLIPVSCLLFIIGQFWHPNSMRRIGVKFAVVGLVLYSVIPVGLRVSDIIYDTYQESIDYTIMATEELTDETSELASAAESQGLIPSITNKVSDATDEASNVLKRYIEALAVMIVTSCVIPVLILLFALWVIKVIAGTEDIKQLYAYKKGTPNESPEADMRI